jgi:transposase-like protein
VKKRAKEVKKKGGSERRRPEIKRDALDRMRTTTNICKLSKELGIPRRTLYAWRDRELVRVEKLKRKPETREQQLEQEVARIKQALGEATLDLDFFRGALQKIWDRQQPSSAVGGSASTSKSGK